MNQPCLIGASIIALVALLCTHCQSRSIKKEVESPIRLPDHIQPLHYEVKLDLSQPWSNKYKGQVDIEFLVVSSVPSESSRWKRFLPSCFASLQCSPMSDIVLHAGHDIEIKSVDYRQVSRKSNTKRFIDIDEVVMYESTGILIIRLNREIEKDARGYLSIEFSGVYRNDMRGVYQKSYNLNNKDYTYTVSSFQPSDARLVFPCFDEPALKATFEFEITHSASDTVKFNTEPNYSIKGIKHNTRVTRFAKTPNMSVHMLGFVIGSFESVSANYVQGEKEIPVTVYSPIGYGNKGLFALEVATRALEYMHQYLKSDYPLNKFDIVTVFDHETDNTESWGLCVIRAPVALFDDDTDESLKVTIAINVAHVVAHQWFANLVTARWWDDIWITEGIASQKAFEIVRTLYPEFQSDYLVRLGALSPSLDSDDSIFSHPISVSSDKFTGSVMNHRVFDNLTFTKSGSLMDHIKKRLSKIAWIEMHRMMVQQFSYSSVGKQDLEDMIQSASISGRDFLSHFDALIHTTGTPKLIYSSVDDGPLKQTMIPYNVPEMSLAFDFHDSSNEHESQRVYSKVTVDEVPLPEWFKTTDEKHWFSVEANSDLSDWFRLVFTDGWATSKVTNSIAQKKIPPMKRLRLLDDFTAGVKYSGMVSPALFRKYLASFNNEDHGVIIMKLAGIFSALDDEFLKKFMENNKPEWMYTLYKKYGLNSLPEGTTFADSRGLSSSLSYLVHAGDQEIIQALLEKFDAGQGKTLVHLRAPTYEAIVKQGGAERIEKLLVMLAETDSLQERQRLVSALSTVQDPSVHERLSKLQA